MRAKVGGPPPPRGGNSGKIILYLGVFFSLWDCYFSLWETIFWAYAPLQKFLLPPMYQLSIFYEYLQHHYILPEYSGGGLQKNIFVIFNSAVFKLCSLISVCVCVLLAPSWVPDEDVLHCSACKAPFTFVRRRHHCRNCGKVSGENVIYNYTAVRTQNALNFQFGNC